MTELLKAVAIAIVPVIGGLLIKVANKWLGNTLTQQQIEAALMWLINLITTIEQSKSGATGAQKQDAVVSLARQTMPQEMLNAVVAKYGNLDTAVEAAFQRSHLATKAKK